jgi:hypothetical protein
MSSCHHVIIVIIVISPLIITISTQRIWGYMVVQFVEALRYKPEGRDFAFRGAGIRYWLNPSGRNVALGATKPPTDLSTSIISWGCGDKSGRCVGLTSLPSSCADCLEILGASASWKPKGLSTSVIG